MIKSFKAFAMVLLLSNFTYAADNSIYVDQSGDNSTIDITQTGAGNVIRSIQGAGTSNATPAKLYGNGSLVDIRQVGSDNTANIGFNVTTAAGMGYGIDLTYYVTGNSGSATFNINNAGTGTAASNTIDVRQTGNSAGINLNMLGSKNSFIATTAGGSNNTITATVNADETTNNIAVSGGGSNGITLNLTSSKATNSITMVGASNTLGLTQSGLAGTNGHAFTLNLTGSSNAFTVNQSGTIDTTVNILSTGSGNTWNITTGN